MENIEKFYKYNGESKFRDCIAYEYGQKDAILLTDNMSEKIKNIKALAYYLQGGAAFIQRAEGSAEIWKNEREGVHHICG